MLRVVHGNRVERLFEALADLLQVPVGRALEPETIAVQTPGMGRWLTLEITRRLGVAANLRFPLPGVYIWELMRKQLSDIPEHSRYDRGVLSWRIMAQLPGCLDRPGFEPVRGYLEDCSDELKCYQLATVIADLFDQYLVFRPDWISAWESDAGQAGWQSALWQILVADAGADHRAAVVQRYVEVLESGNVAADGFPHRIIVFGMAALPPVYLRVLEALARYTEVHLFVLNPCLSYWGDIVDAARVMQLRKLWRSKGRGEVADLYTVGNSLLASWGKVTRDTLELVHESNCDDDEVFDVELPDTLLGHVQGDLLLLQECTPQGELAVREIEPQDRSVEVHLCHDPMREVEVLHDQLLALLDNHPLHPGLRPADIVVMTPDIDTFAPYIEAVFGSAPEERRIPWSVADRTPQSEHPVVQTFLQLLRLPGSRFEATEIASLLEIPAIGRRAGIDEAALEQLLHWIGDAGIRWGVDSAARAAAGVPDSEENTWQFGFDRLLLGYAMADETHRWQGINPSVDVEGSTADDLGRLCRFVDRLGGLQRRLRGRRPFFDWRLLINEVLDLFDTSTDSGAADAVQMIRDCTDRLADDLTTAGFDRALGVEVLRSHLESALHERAPVHRFLSGGVTFCRLTPLRSIPFQVVCLIGMNDGVFPAQKRPPGFDLIANDPHPRRGDRSRREDDRHLFLEALLSARQKLYISYQARSPRDNSDSLPSVLVTELLDYLDRGFCLAGGAALDELRVEHPLQPFSRAYRDPRSPYVFTYADHWLRASLGLDADVPFVSASFGPAKDLEPALSIDDLVGFLKNPARYFLRERLGLSLARYQTELADTETFGIEGLDDYWFKQEYLQYLLSGGEDSAWFDLQKGRGQLPHGEFAQLLFDRYRQLLPPFSELVTSARGDLLEPLESEYNDGELSVGGRLSSIGANALVTCRFTAPKADDLLALWVRHLLLNLAATPGYPQSSRHLGADGKEFRLERVAGPERYLRELLQCYREGLERPLRFFPRSALAYARDIYQSGDPAKALKAARGAWFSSTYSTYAEETNPDFALTTRGLDALDDEFCATALRVFAPIIEHLGGKF